MQNLNAKTIITASGVILLLIAGALTMLLMPSEQEALSQTVQLKTQPEPSTGNSQLQNQPSNIWYVYVTGAVKSPGVYKLSEDSRIFHAIEASGGFTSKADETSLNLAEPLADGVHVHVAQKGELSNSSVMFGGLNHASESEPRQLSRTQGQIQTVSYVRNSQSSGSLIDINSASEIELQKLDGVGPAISKRIIEYRQAHGAFSRPEDLLRIKGIGQAKLNKMRSQIQIRQ